MLSTVLCLLVTAGAAHAQSGAAKAVAFEKRDHVELEGTKGFNLNSAFTIEMWATWSMRDRGSQYFLADEAWPGMSEHIAVKQESGCALRTTVLSRRSRAVEFVMGSTNGWFEVTGREQPDLGGWHHFAVTKTDQVIRLFRDGKLDVEKRCAGVTFNASPTNLYLGVREHAFQDRVFHGGIRAVRISTRARYEKSFKPQRTFASDDATLVLLDFTAGKGDRIPDLSGNNHEGIIVGARWVDPRRIGNP
jgi:hypothetical protein